jgi:hypothetical protein
MLKLYLDNCCYNRPFDDLSQKTIAEEAQAFDYTQWRRDNLFSGETLEEINEKASEYERIHGTPKLRTARRADD